MIRPFLGPVVWPNSDNFRDYMWQEMPEARHVIADLEQESEDLSGDPDIGTYSYLSEAFFWSVLVNAIDADPPREYLLERYFGIIETLLGSDDEMLVEAVSLTIAEALRGRRRWLEAARRFGGPLVKEDIVQNFEHPEWFSDDFEGPIPPDPNEPEGKGPRTWLGE